MTVIKPASAIPFSLQRRASMPAAGVTILAGDIGGTKTNLAYFKATPDELNLVQLKRYSSTDHNTLQEIILHFLAEVNQPAPDRICLGVAGPVLNGKVELTNLNWVLDATELTSQLKVSEVRLINDLESMAYGLAAIPESDFITLHKGNAVSGGNMAIIAPGTGLGQAGLYWSTHNYYPFPTEGGHCDFAPRTDLDMELLRYLQSKYTVVSWEHVIAGPGIYDLYQFMRDVKKHEEPTWLTEKLSSEDPSAVISQAAMQQQAAICVETMDLYVRYLAREASNLVLKMKATGGLFLGGGIPPKIAPLLQQESFFRHYMDCDRMQHLLETVPIKIIKNDKTGLLGAAYYGAYGD